MRSSLTPRLANSERVVGLSRVVRRHPGAVPPGSDRSEVRPLPCRCGTGRQMLIAIFRSMSRDKAARNRLSLRSPPPTLLYRAIVHIDRCIPEHRTPRMLSIPLASVVLMNHPR